MNNDKLVKKYDLEERTAIFGEEIIKLCRVIKKEKLTEPVVEPTPEPEVIVEPTPEPASTETTTAETTPIT